MCNDTSYRRESPVRLPRVKVFGCVHHPACDTCPFLDCIWEPATPASKTKRTPPPVLVEGSDAPVDALWITDKGRELLMEPTSMDRTGGRR